MNLAEILREHLEAVNTLLLLEDNINRFAEMSLRTLQKGNKMLLMGNGGSAADCQHFAAELVGRFKKERRGLPALALSTDTSILTSLGNDYSFDIIFARQVEALAREGDLVVGLSTSGTSVNIVKGLQKAKEMRCSTVGLLGRDGGTVKDVVDLSLIVPVNDTARVQECHIIIIHIVCQMIEEGLE
jgi:D-sedoheptulose 7-phosphate isomerase